jgi:hypothetical protein
MAMIENCAVCYEEFREGLTFTTVCGHEFCVGCVYNLSQRGFTACPMCRTGMGEVCVVRMDRVESIAEIVLRGENALMNALNEERHENYRVGEVEEAVVRLRTAVEAYVEGEFNWIINNPGRLPYEYVRRSTAVNRTLRYTWFAEKVSKGAPLS